jgi:hypothetical protein
MKKAALVAALALSLTGFAQNGKLGFQKGQKLEVTTERKREFFAERNNTIQYNVTTSTLTTTYSVHDVTPSGSIVEQKVKRLLVDEGEGKSRISFDSEKRRDLGNAIGKSLAKTINEKYILTLDPVGKITEVGGDNANLKETDEPLEGPTALMLASVGMPLFSPKAGTGSIFHILPTSEVKQGDTWADSSAHKGFQQKVFYTVTGITDSEILLDFIEDVFMEYKMKFMGLDATKTSNSKSTGKMTIDRKTRILKQKTFTTDIEATLDAFNRKRPSKEKITTTLTVK